MIQPRLSVVLFSSTLALAASQAFAQRLPQDPDRSAASRGDSRLESQAERARGEERRPRGYRPSPAATPDHPGGLYPVDPGRSASVGSSSQSRRAPEAPNRTVPY